MIFVGMIRRYPGDPGSFIKKVKHPQIPPGIRVVGSYGEFGSFDCVILFESRDEETAVNFMLQFAEFGRIRTQLAIPIGDLRWIH